MKTQDQAEQEDDAGGVVQEHRLVKTPSQGKKRCQRQQMRAVAQGHGGSAGWERRNRYGIGVYNGEIKQYDSC